MLNPQVQTGYNYKLLAIIVLVLFSIVPESLNVSVIIAVEFVVAIIVMWLRVVLHISANNS